MKKLLLLLLLIFISCPAFAEYKPIPKELSKKYKAEITQLIRSQYPIAIREIEETRAQAHVMFLNDVKDKNLYMDYALNNFDMIIDNGEFHLLSKIIDVTNKYVDIKNDTALATDYVGALLDFLDPYFKDNRINKSKLNYIDTLVSIKAKEIEKEQRILYKFVYP